MLKGFSWKKIRDDPDVLTLRCKFQDNIEYTMRITHLFVMKPIYDKMIQFVFADINESNFLSQYEYDYQGMQTTRMTQSWYDSFFATFLDKTVFVDPEEQEPIISLKKPKWNTRHKSKDKKIHITVVDANRNMSTYKMMNSQKNDYKNDEFTTYKMMN